MRKAFDKVYGTGKKPTLTITICGKRHHARFYPMKNEEASKNGNTKPGTVVDKGVTDVFRFDYYLQAHNGLQVGEMTTLVVHRVDIPHREPYVLLTIPSSTTRTNFRPMKFNKGLSKLRTDLQTLVGAHMFSSTASYHYVRATKAVSLIPPAYYADLACERARLYLNDLLNLGLETASSAGGRKRDREAEKKQTFDRAVAAWGQGVHPNLRETMFYI
jgi:eukaryotic translation initiation factor 2C